MKLTLLGAGIRTPLLIHGLVSRQDALKIDEVCLFDTDAGRLETMSWLVTALSIEWTARFTVTNSSTIEEAVNGASFIFSSIRVGQEAGRVADERIALDHGVIGQETTGPGGFAMALRTIPVVLDYARVIERVSPEAWFINFTNPAGLITQALTTCTSLKVIGICDTPTAMRTSIASYLVCDVSDLYIEYAGLNHLGWVRSVLVDGRDVLNDLIADFGGLQKAGHEWQLFDPGLVQSIGMLPNEYLYYYYYRDEAIQHVVESKGTRGRQIAAINASLWQAMADDRARDDWSVAIQRYVSSMSERSGSYMSRESGASARAQAAPIDWRSSTLFEDESYAGLALDVLQAITRDRQAVLILNVVNGTAIRELAENDVVETTCMVDRHGVRPFAQRDMPASVAGLVASVKQYERLTITSAVEGNRRAGIAALAGHPLVMSWPLAQSLVDAYLLEHAALLPQFNH